MTSPKISELYYIINQIKSQSNSPEFIEGTESINQEFLDDFNKFNNLIQKLIDSINSSNSNEILELLIDIRIQSMNVESIFSNLTDELTKVIPDL